jgi:hypothetical protein
MTAEDYEKYPDIRAFGVYITDEMRTAVLDKFARILMHVEMEIPPKLELDKFTFNNFKTACITSLTEDEIEDIRISIERINKSRMPDWKKRQYNQTLSEIEDILNVG